PRTGVVASQPVIWSACTIFAVQVGKVAVTFGVPVNPVVQLAVATTSRTPEVPEPWEISAWVVNDPKFGPVVASSANDTVPAAGSIARKTQMTSPAANVAEPLAPVARVVPEVLDWAWARKLRAGEAIARPPWSSGQAVTVKLHDAA